ncbi:MAG: hypothetical protein FJX75_11905 [Armatimonadetes bacterium]|nr:hypothetical protein [Armatimonadota bacterium]
MAAPVDQTPEYVTRSYRRRAWPWALAGMLLVMVAAIYSGSDLSELARQHVGPHLLVASWFAAGATGGLLLLVATSIYAENVVISEAAVEHYRLGRRDLRILWKDVERIVLHKSHKRPKGAVEIRGPKGSSVVVDPRTVGFDELEAAVLERAQFFGLEVRSYR